jgi:hypothetical protein
VEIVTQDAAEENPDAAVVETEADHPEVEVKADLPAVIDTEEVQEAVPAVDQAVEKDPAADQVADQVGHLAEAQEDQDQETNFR